MTRHARIALSLLLLPGCGGAVAPPQPAPLSGPAVLEAVGKAVNAAGDRLQNSLLFVDVQLQGGQGGQVTGMVVAGDGTLLLPILLERDRVQRIRVWAGGKEHPADFLKADERLRMTLVKAAPSAGPFAPVPAGVRAAPGRGEWLVGLTASGKDTDFQLFASLGLVRGRVPQEFDQILLDGGGGPPGTVLTDLDGNIVGLVGAGGPRQQPQALAFGDIRKRLDALLSPAAATAEAADGKDKGKPAIGIVFEPINEDYAEASGLPKEAIWARHVFQGQPAARAGVVPGDLVVEVNGRPLGASGQRGMQSLFKLLSPDLGREVTLGLLRDGKPAAATCRFEKSPEPRELKAEDLGLQVKEISDSVFYATDNLFERQGVLVTDIVRGGPASTSSSFRVALVNPGDVITAVDGQPTPTLEAFSSALDALRRKGAPVTLLTIRRGVSLTHAALNLTLRQDRKGEPR